MTTYKSNRPYAVPDTTVGHVALGERRTVSFDVTVTPKRVYDEDKVTEFLLTVNGRTVKRMTLMQAQKLGLVQMPTEDTF